MNENTSSASCFLLGVLVGAAGALLFAPYTGEDTRRRLSSGVARGGRKLAEKTQSAASNIKDTAGRVVESGKAAFKGQKERVNEAFDEGVRAYNEATAGMR